MRNRDPELDRQTAGAVAGICFLLMLVIVFYTIAWRHTEVMNNVGARVRSAAVERAK